MFKKIVMKSNSGLGEVSLSVRNSDPATSTAIQDQDDTVENLTDKHTTRTASTNDMLSKKMSSRSLENITKPAMPSSNRFRYLMLAWRHSPNHVRSSPARSRLRNLSPNSKPPSHS
jgi:hypothetical protein